MSRSRTSVTLATHSTNGRNMSNAPQPTLSGRTSGQARGDAELYQRQRRTFHLHVGVSAGSMVIIFLVNLAVNTAANITGEWWAWWSVLALVGWGLGVAVHGLVLQLARPRSFGSAEAGA